MRKLRKLLVWMVILAAGGTAVWWFFFKGDPAEEAAYRAEKVDRGDIHLAVTATGTVSAVTTVQVGSQVSGIIARLYADFNSRVRKGQLLAELDPTNFLAQVDQRRADLARAKVQAANAEVTFRRQERLRQEGLTSAEEFDAAKAALDTAVAEVSQSEASLIQAEVNLKNTKILSPIDGMVVDRQYDVGQTVAASFQAPTLFTIAQDLTRMQVQADVDQADIGRVKVGQTATFTVDAFPETEFKGRITQVRLNATVNQNVITYPVIVEVDNPEEKLRPKMTADISIDVAVVRDALRIPNAALRFRPPESPGSTGDRPAGPGGVSSSPGPSAPGRMGGPPSSGGGDPRKGMGKRPLREQTVYLLRPLGVLEGVKVQTGISDGKYTEVTQGELKEGDEVVTGVPTTRAESSSGGSRPFGMRGF